MKPHAGGDIEVQVCMMHAVYPPKDWNSMEHHVLQVDGEVHDDHGYYDDNSLRYLEVIENAPSVLLSKYRHAYRCRGKDDAQQEAVQEHDSQIINPAKYL
ncbi:hypothetical protein BROSI_A3310 [Candidatus Brocadia sinica JPN1]|uniref:Uncharacterized protein n=1 Tax=Candidatus Brocadia sinica JPN1 TaxID=1197129 RepID=A0ABQ0K201_9BACT|nr:hypothetical protein BROSI_A3310 [Candidatus Brocadia sinica JPN1]GIK11785.1 MAG: hypothetical protein BroJett002_04920 [Candidatus Brocadia sinica]GJQ18658.1 MAG: hypothetical protein HBSIN01_26170 [Candidatus Brocadia sinica]